MKDKFMASFAILTLALASALSISAQAQTTKEGPGPSEQPSAPMEIGQPSCRELRNSSLRPGNRPKWEKKPSPVDRQARARPRLTRVWAASA